MSKCVDHFQKLLQKCKNVFLTEVDLIRNQSRKNGKISQLGMLLDVKKNKFAKHSGLPVKSGFETHDLSDVRKVHVQKNKTKKDVFIKLLDKYS